MYLHYKSYVKCSFRFMLHKNIGFIRYLFTVSNTTSISVTLLCVSTLFGPPTHPNITDFVLVHLVYSFSILSDQNKVYTGLFHKNSNSFLCSDSRWKLSTIWRWTQRYHKTPKQPTKVRGIESARKVPRKSFLATQVRV